MKKYLFYVSSIATMCLITLTTIIGITTENIILVAILGVLTIIVFAVLQVFMFIKLFQKPKDTTFLDRLYIEKEELVEKYKKLDAFIISDQFKTLSVENKKLLVDQKNTMKVYLTILQTRIELAENEKDARS